MNTEVGAVYDAALERLSRSGVTIEAVEWPELDEIPGMNAKGGLAAAEMYARVRDPDRRHARPVRPQCPSQDSPRGRAGCGGLIDSAPGAGGPDRRIEARVEGYDAWSCRRFRLSRLGWTSLNSAEEYDRVNQLSCATPPSPHARPARDHPAVRLADRMPVGLMLWATRARMTRCSRSRRAWRP